jgi:hypothetical protein
MVTVPPHPHTYGPCKLTKLSNTYRQTCTVAGCGVSRPC